MSSTSSRSRWTRRAISLVGVYLFDATIHKAVSAIRPSHGRAGDHRHDPMAHQEHGHRVCTKVLRRCVDDGETHADLEANRLLLENRSPPGSTERSTSSTRAGVIVRSSSLDDHAALDLEESSTLPSIRAVIVSSRSRLASRMGVSFPVSIHQPCSTSWRTRWPCSMSHWIASVISSSPRADGSIAATASWIVGVEEVHADQREVGRRVDRLLDEARRPRRAASTRRRRSAADRGRARAGSAPPAAGRSARRRAARTRRRTRRGPAGAGCRRGTSRSRRRRGSRARSSTQWASPSGCVLGDVRDLEPRTASRRRRRP